MTEDTELKEPLDLEEPTVLPEEVEDFKSVAVEEEVAMEEEPLFEDKATTVVTHMTNKTFISQLQNDLAEERMAREKLEKELEDIKQITVEIQSKMN